MTAGLKDVTLMINSSSAVGVDFETGKIVKRKLEHGVAHGMGEQDWSSIYEITRQNSGLS